MKIKEITNKKVMIKAVTITLLAVVTTFQACGPGQLSKKEFSSNQPNGGGNNNNGNGNDFVPGPGGSMIPVEATKTVGVDHSENIVLALVSMAGTRVASARTLTAANIERTKIAESGKADSVNAPMWMAITNLSGEVCWDLVLQEKALAADQRRIFGQVNFTAGPATVSDAAKDDVIRRLARSAWARNETDAEKSMIKAALGTFNSATAADTDRAMLFTCASIMASLDAHDR